MDPTLTDTIDMYGDPLGFKFRQGRGPSPLASAGRDVVKVEARQMAGHQKEAVVADGAEASAWRLTSDEGVHLKGDDLAPFPLGFFNAGMQGDLYLRLRNIAAERGIALDGLEIGLINHYWLTGSFIHGTGEGHAESPDIEVRLKSSAGKAEIESLVAAALNASPAIALARTPLAGNTFALYINGRRREVPGVNSPAGDAVDPYRAHSKPPRPLDANGRGDLIVRPGVTEQGTPAPAQATITGKQLRNIHGEGRPLGDGLFNVDTWLAMPGVSHFHLLCDAAGKAAPSGLALLSAGIAFCYMTQLSRYIENMKMNIRRVRLMQFNPFVAGAKAAVEPIDTHLFLDGEAPEEAHLQLLTIAARTCYLHAAAKTPTDPNVRIVHNGQAIPKAA
jgi:uncharacterized OsmC-like protein